jgi:hypothetical protein
MQRFVGNDYAEAVCIVDADGNVIDSFGGGGSSHDRELVVTTYRVKTAFTGASVDDTVTCTQVIDVKHTPSTVSTIWRNQTTATDLATVPSAANLALEGSQALTDAQLRAAAVAISAASLPLPTGAASEATLAALSTKIPTQGIPGLLPVDTLGTPSRMTPQSVTASSGSVSLLPATRRVSVDVSVSAVVRINGTASVPANGSSLVDAIAIPAGSTKDFDVPGGAVLHFIRDGTSDGTIRITEIV